MAVALLGEDRASIEERVRGEQASRDADAEQRLRAAGEEQTKLLAAAEKERVELLERHAMEMRRMESMAREMEVADRLMELVRVATTLLEAEVAARAAAAEKQLMAATLALDQSEAQLREAREDALEMQRRAAETLLAGSGGDDDHSSNPGVLPSGEAVLASP